MRLRQSLYDYCVACDADALLRQWYPTKNAPLTPKTVTYGSRQKVWWQCEKGHTWQTAVYTRTGPGSGCPYCAGKRVFPNENDLQSQRPDLAAQWHPTKNGTVTPADVTVGSHHKAWWICEKGHEWQAIVNSRVSGCDCPFCSNRALMPGENDLAITCPELALEWHPVKNGSLTPRDVLAGSHRKVWWRCERGHEWQAMVLSRVSGCGCPVCAGKRVIPGENDLDSRFPAIAIQWLAERNGALTPQTVSPYSNRRVWWRCELGHEYQAAVAARTMGGNGCPYCAGKKVMAGFNDLAALEPEIAAQWHPTLNGTLTPEMVTAGSHHKVWWQCPAGHVWKAMVYSRAGPQKCGCPVCAGRVKPERQARYAAMTEVNPAAKLLL